MLHLLYELLIKYILSAINTHNWNEGLLTSSSSLPQQFMNILQLLDLDVEVQSFAVTSNSMKTGVERGAANWIMNWKIAM